MATTPTLDTTHAAHLLAIGKDLANRSFGYFQSTFAHVPDDKLNWTPGGKAKSPLRIAAHLAVSQDYFAGALRGAPPVDGDFPAIMAWMNVEEQKIATREEALARLGRSMEDLNAAIDACPPELVAGSEDAQFVLNLAGRHLMMHAGQIDAYQLIWGDDELHFGG